MKSVQKHTIFHSRPSRVQDIHHFMMKQVAPYCSGVAQIQVEMDQAEEDKLLAGQPSLA